MTSFLEDVITDLQNKQIDISKLTFILPSKRAGTFLKNLVCQHTKKASFSPEIVSIESFIESLSDIRYAQNTEVLFEFYSAYKSITPNEQQETFDGFSKWAPLLLQDFNEVDRYLIPSDALFNYLNAIKELNHWSLQKDQTDYVKNYLSFWTRLPSLYSAFKESLLEKKKGYQGLIYREAINNLEQYTATNQDKKFVFIGFNALNKAEEVIIQELLQQDLASIYWDIDERFINDPIHDVGFFARIYKSHWPYFAKHPFNWITKNYSSLKNMNIIGAPKQVGQVKYIGELLDQLYKTQESLSNTAVILGDENLLIPLLNSIPRQIKNINVTMGLPLKSIPMTSVFEHLFKLHKTASHSLYYKDIISIISNPFIAPLFVDQNTDYSEKIKRYLGDNNVVYLNVNTLKSISKSKNSILDLLFKSWGNNPAKAIQKCLTLILLIKNSLESDDPKNLLTLEYLYRFNLVFSELQTLNEKHNHIGNINMLHIVYKEIIANETLDFQGEPLQGLQIMGMLESRVLDFETVIISSVNEGILPAGKSNSSFIPFDVKLENGLPTYREKDAVYAYHFYRLLQRAKNVYILYNTEPDVLNGGEKSRFISQLEVENGHRINHFVVSPKVPLANINLKEIIKTKEIIDKLKAIAKEGFSPTSLTNYIRNPLDFYYEKILDINTFEDIEETVAANTLGSIIHSTLEDLYSPYKNQLLAQDHIKKAISLIQPTVKKHFKKLFKEGDISRGKNLIVFEIAKRYVSNFLNKEMELLKNGNSIKIIALEEKFTMKLDIQELDFPVHLKGTVDRIDEFNGVIRVIDYKSGKVFQNQVEVVEWDDILNDYENYSKSFQVLCYALMLNSQYKFSNPIEAGIISFKSLKGDYFLKFAKKESRNSRNKDSLITPTTIDHFFTQLKKLILEICNSNIPFKEKVIK